MPPSDDTEIVFEQKVVELAHMFGWKVASFRPASTSKGFRTPVKYDGKGYPDLTLIHEQGYIIFAEMKRDKNASPTTSEQLAWGDTIAHCATGINVAANALAVLRVQYRLWRPRDGNQIANELSFGRVKEWRP